MIPKQQKIATRPLHTIRFYQMWAALIAFVLAFWICCESGDPHPTIFCSIGIVINIATTLIGLYTGKYVTPELSRYSGVSYRREYDNIVRSFMLSVVASALMAAILIMTVRNGTIAGQWQ